MASTSFLFTPDWYAVGEATWPAGLLCVPEEESLLWVPLHHGPMSVNFVSCQRLSNAHYAFEE